MRGVRYGIILSCPCISGSESCAPFFKRDHDLQSKHAIPGAEDHLSAMPFGNGH